MSRRTRNVIIVLVLLALLFLALWLWLSGRQPAAVGPVDADEINANVSRSLGGQLDTSYTGKVNTNVPTAPVDEPPAPPAEPAKPDTRANLRRLAAAFAERYGSFSNISNFENLLDLKFFMTADMAGRTDQYVADSRAQEAGTAGFFSSTTRAISAEVVELDETAGTAKVSVQTQRQTVTGGTENPVYYQELVLTYRRPGEVWQVDSAEWQPQP